MHYLLSVVQSEALIFISLPDSRLLPASVLALALLSFVRSFDCLSIPILCRLLVLYGDDAHSAAICASATTVDLLHRD